MCDKLKISALLIDNFNFLNFFPKGFGDSDKPTSVSEYSMGKIVQELKSLVEMLSGMQNEIIFVGHGLGGLIAWYFLDQFPNLVSKFVCISTPHPKSFRDFIGGSWKNIQKNRYIKNFSKTLYFSTAIVSFSFYYFSKLPYFPEFELCQLQQRLFTRRFDKISSELKAEAMEAYNFTFSGRSKF